MNANTSQEQKLKDLIEGRSIGATQSIAKAGLLYSVYEKRLGGISYDEAIQLVKENEEMLEHMPIHDPAYEFLIKAKFDMLRWASVLNDFRILGRHDHELPVHALVSVRGVEVECNFYISKYQYAPSQRNRIIESKLRENIMSSSEWAGGFRNPPKIDFVEL